MNFLQFLILFTIFLLPLVSFGGRFGYEQSKVVFFLFSSALIGFFLLGRSIKWTSIGITGALFTAVLFLSSFLAGFTGSFLGKDPYFQGWILYLYLFLFYIIVKEFKIGLEKYAFILCLSALLVSFWAIKDWVLFNLLGVEIPTYAGRVVSSFGQPNFYSGFLLMTLPFSYLLIKNSNQKIKYFGLTSVLVSFTAIILSYSRSAILIALILAAWGLAAQLKFHRFKISFVIFAVIAASTLAGVIVFSGIAGSELSRPASIKNPDLTKGPVEKRAYIWPWAINVILVRPLTGYGLENIDYAFSNYFDRHKHTLFEENLKISPVLISLKDLNIDRSHNYPLDLLLFSGIFGLGSWLFLIAMLIVRGRGILLVSLSTYLIWIQFQNQSIVHLIYFWLLAGLIDKSESYT